ncbi:MAG: KH domain-containing protein [Minisyncoccia bacterium]
MEQDHAFLDFVVKALVDHPDDVVIVRTVDEMGVLLVLTVHPEDMGKMIGRDGNTAKSLRTLLRVVGMKHNARVNLKINEPVGGKRALDSDREEKTVDQVVDELV